MFAIDKSPMSPAPRVRLQIHRMNKNTVLVLCGEGKLEDDIKAKTKALGLENDVIFTAAIHMVDNFSWAYGNRFNVPT